MALSKKLFAMVYKLRVALLDGGVVVFNAALGTLKQIISNANFIFIIELAILAPVS